MKKDRLIVISKKLIEYINKTVGDDGEKLYSILANDMGMTDNEIDYIVLGEE